MRPPRLRTPTALLGVVAMGLSSGCSSLFAGGHTPQTCSSSFAPVVVDVLLGIVALGSGGTGVALGTTLDDGAGIAALGLVGVAGGIGHFVSAANNRVGHCRRSQANPYAPSTRTPGLWDLAEPGPEPWSGDGVVVTLQGHYRDERGDYRKVEAIGGTADVQVGFLRRVQLGLAVSYGDYAVDNEDYGAPNEHYRLTSIAPRVTVEIVERTPDVFGLGVRVRPSWGWSSYGEEDRDARTGWPLIALILGTTDVWVDFGGGETNGLDDPRYFHLALGIRAGIVDVEVGSAGVGHYDLNGAVFTTRLDVRLAASWTLATRMELGGVFGFSGGLAYHFSP